jgi:hypothetical protein
VSVTGFDVLDVRCTRALAAESATPESFAEVRGGTATSRMQQRTEKEKQEGVRLTRSAGERDIGSPKLGCDINFGLPSHRACLRWSEAVQQQ